MREPLILLPGLMCDARVFLSQIVALSAEGPVTVSPLTRGERIDEMASDLLTGAPQRFALAGMGLGGMVALEVLRRAPDRVTRIALLDTDPLAETPQQAAERDPLMIRVKAGKLDEVMDTLVPSEALAPTPWRLEVRAQVREMARALGPEVFLRQMRALQRRRDQQGTLRRAKVPMLILCGARDPVYPVRRHSFMAELVQGSVLTVVEDAGLLPTLEQPDVVTKALQGWMRAPYVLR